MTIYTLKLDEYGNPEARILTEGNNTGKPSSILGYDDVKALKQEVSSQYPGAKYVLPSVFNAELELRRQEQE